MEFSCLQAYAALCILTFSSLKTKVLFLHMDSMFLQQPHLGVGDLPLARWDPCPVKVNELQSFRKNKDSNNKSPANSECAWGCFALNRFNTIEFPFYSNVWRLELNIFILVTDLGRKKWKAEKERSEKTQVTHPLICVHIGWFAQFFSCRLLDT